MKGAVAVRWLMGILAIGWLAGCASPDAVPRTDPPFDYAALEAAIGEPLTEDGPDPSYPDHYNLARVAAVSGEEGRTPEPSEGYVETAVKNGYAYLCRTGPEQGLVIFDVRDIEKPTQVGFIALEAGFEADIEVSDDGKWAFWETQRFPTSAEGPNPTEPGANAQRGIHIVDIVDKTNPIWRGFTPVTPDGPHAITYANISGRHIVFASTYAFAYAYGNVAPPDQQRLVIMELDTSGPVAQMRTLAEYTDPDYSEPNPAQAKGGQFPHDVSVAVHPVTGQTIAYVAYWDFGVVMLDVSVPESPVRLGAATDFGAAPTKEIHMARQSNGLIDGKVIVAAEPEIGAQETTGYMSHIDVTDPANPLFVSNWKIPGNASSAGGGRGPHYFDFVDGRIVMASYSAGFWVYDLHDHDNLLRPRTVGYAFVGPAENTGLPGPAAGLGGGSAFDAWWADPTHVVGSETSGGLVVFRYEGPTEAVES